LYILIKFTFETHLNQHCVLFFYNALLTRVFFKYVKVFARSTALNIQGSLNQQLYMPHTRPP